jgi:hypothetical protein
MAYTYSMPTVAVTIITNPSNIYMIDDPQVKFTGNQIKSVQYLSNVWRNSTSFGVRHQSSWS